MQKTAIEWATHSSNPIYAEDTDTGARGWFCTFASPGCLHCYSQTLNKRFGNKLTYTANNERRVRFHLNEKEVAAIRRVKDPRRVFFCDMTDLFHDMIPVHMIATVLQAVKDNPNVTGMFLTKRAKRMSVIVGGLVKQWGEVPDNLWFGVSAEDQRRLLERWEHLRRTPAAVRFLSLEPLLGPLDLTPCLWEEAGPEWAGSNLAEPGPDWIITGGESGSQARPAHPDWFRSLRDQCAAANAHASEQTGEEHQTVGFFLKQWGEWAPHYEDGEEKSEGMGTHGAYLEGNVWHIFKRGQAHGDVFKVGKKAAGRLLDGRTHDAMPPAHAGRGGTADGGRG